jgi:hypothetical protein
MTRLILREAARPDGSPVRTISEFHDDEAGLIFSEPQLAALDAGKSVETCVHGHRARYTDLIVHYLTHCSEKVAA